MKFTKPNYDIDADLEYGACNDQSCLPPSSVSFKKTGKSPAVDGETDKNKEEEDKAKAEAEAKAKADSLAALAAAAADSAAMGAPVDSAALAALDHDARCGTSSCWVCWADWWHCSPPVYGPSSP